MNNIEFVLVLVGGVLLFIVNLIMNFRVYAALSHKSDIRDRVYQAQIKFLRQQISNLRSGISISPNMEMRVITSDEIPNDIKEILGNLFGQHTSDNQKQSLIKQRLLMELKKYPKAVYKETDDVDYLETVLSLFKEEE